MASSRRADAGESTADVSLAGRDGDALDTCVGLPDRTVERRERGADALRGYRRQRGGQQHGNKSPAREYPSLLHPAVSPSDMRDPGRRLTPRGSPAISPEN